MNYEPTRLVHGTRTNATLQRLETELDHLKHKFHMGQELKLQWTPKNGLKSGEVAGITIRIYEATKAKALDTSLINKLISLFEEEMYDRKEMLIEGLRNLAV